MDIWDVDKLVLFIAFVIPGFVSIKTYQLGVRRQHLWDRFSSGLTECFCSS